MENIIQLTKQCVEVPPPPAEGEDAPMRDEGKDQLLMVQLKTELFNLFLSQSDEKNQLQVVNDLSDKYFAQIIKDQYLQSKQEKQRIKAMQIIKEIIIPFIFEQLSKTEKQELTDSLLTLFTDIVLEVFEKVRDIYCVFESLNIIGDQVISEGLKIEAVRSTYTQNFVTKLLSAISSPNLHVPQYNFKTRNKVYRIYEQISYNRKDLLDKLNSTLYISCVLSGIENEGDPRNLLLVYDLLHFLLLNFCQASQSSEDLEPFIEDIFDKTSCYFPINFDPPKDDKFKITPEILKAKLKACFLASEHPQMIDNIFPFVLEKLTSSNQKTKIECLDLLDEMIAKFTHTPEMREHFAVTISTLQNEFFNRFETEIQQKTKSSLCNILNSIENKQNFVNQQQKGVFKSDKALSIFTKSVLDKSLEQIKEEPAGMAAFLGSMLISCLAGSQGVLCTQGVMKYVLADQKYYADGEDAHDMQIEVDQPTKIESSVSHGTQASHGHSHGGKACTGHHGPAETPPSLQDRKNQDSESILGIIIKFTDLQKKDPKSAQYDNDAHTAYLQVLVSILLGINGLGAKSSEINKPISAKMRKDIQTEAFDAFLLIDDTLQKIVFHGTLQNDVVFEKTMKFICQLCILAQSVQKFDQIKVVKKSNISLLLDLLIGKFLVSDGLTDNAKMLGETDFDPEAFTTVILDNLAMIIESSKDGYYSEIITTTLYDNMDRFEQKLIHNILKKGFWTDQKSLQYAIEMIQDNKDADIEAYLVPLKQFSGSKEQLDNIVIEFLFKLIQKEEIDDNEDLILKAILQNCSIKLSQQALNKIMSQKVPDLRLVKYIIKYKGLKMEDEGMKFLIGNLTYQFLENENDEMVGNEPNQDSTQAAKAMYYLILRQEPKKELHEKLQAILDEKDNIKCMFYILKALIIRGEQKGFVTLKKLFSESEDIKSYQDSFGQIIAKKMSPYVTKENGFPLVNKIYTQRLFTQLFPVVQEKGSSQIMMQLCGMVSLQMLENQGRLQQLLPIAQATLEIQESENKTPQLEMSHLSSKMTALSLFRKILGQAVQPNSTQEQKRQACGYLDSLIPSILNQLKHQDSIKDSDLYYNQIQIKVECLHTLTMLIEKYPSIELQKHKRIFVGVLTPLIDHKKRVVRKFSRNCLNEWHMM